MTAATLSRPFSNALTYIESVGKWERPRPLTSSADIRQRIDQVIGRDADHPDGRPWTSSPAGLAAFDRFIGLAGQHLTRALLAESGELVGSGDLTARPTITLGQVEDLLDKPAGQITFAHPELADLFHDGLLLEVAPGEMALCAGGGRREIRYPGWSGGDPAGLPRLTLAEQREWILALCQDLIRDGLPAGAAFRDKAMLAVFDDARARQQIQLPMWAIAGLVNLRCQREGRRPISRKTAGSRVAELRDAGALVMTRASKSKWDPDAMAFITISAAYALPKSGLPGIVQKIRARRVRENPPPSEWRQLARRWRQRDQEREEWIPW